MIAAIYIAATVFSIYQFAFAGRINV